MIKSGAAYTLYALLLTGLFLYFLFPADAVERFLVNRFKRNVPGAELIIGEVRPALPPGLVMTPVGVVRADAPLVRLDRLRVTPALLSLIGDRPTADVSVRAFGGRLDGTVSLVRTNGGARAQAAEAAFDGLDLSEVDALELLSPHPVTGRLSGEARYDGGDGSALLTVTDGGVTFQEPLFNVDSLHFARIEARLRIAGGRTLTLEECTLTGNQVGGALSGTLTLDRPLESSVLNLEGELRPHPALIASLGEGAAMLLRQNRGQNAIPFSIRGPIGSPRFSLN
jgi:type II secretion system protein N